MQLTTLAFCSLGLLAMAASMPLEAGNIYVSRIPVGQANSKAGSRSQIRSINPLTGNPHDKLLPRQTQVQKREDENENIINRVVIYTDDKIKEREVNSDNVLNRIVRYTEEKIEDREANSVEVIKRVLRYTNEKIEPREANSDHVLNRIVRYTDDKIEG